MQLFALVGDEKIELFVSAKIRSKLPTYDGNYMRVKNCGHLIHKKDVFAEPNETNLGYSIGSILLFGGLGTLIAKAPGALTGMVLGAIWGMINHIIDTIAVKKFNQS